MRAVFWKELADHFGRRRFAIFVGLIGLAALWAFYVATRSIRAVAGELPSEFLFLQLFTARSGVLPPFLFFFSFFGPLFGIVLGFDAINSERAQGTLARTLSQPLYRDAFFNGKFLAGFATIAIVLASTVILVVALGLLILKFPPSFEAVLRIFFFTLTATVYLSFWLAIAMLCSVWFNRAVASALTSLGLWLLFGFVWVLIAGAIADVVVSDTTQEAEIVRHLQVRNTVERFSPVTLFEEVTTVLLTPTIRSTGPILVERAEGLQLQSPLPVTQSLLLIWPHLVAILGLAGVVFGLSYVRFLREEIRP